ncbi:MAG: peptidoglycan DD-metalloendopeptidase family protein [Patescibacteria group bacterium]
MRFRFLIIFFLFVGVFGAPVLSFAQTASSDNAEIETLNKKIAESREKVKELEDSIAQAKKDIAKKELEGVSLKNQMAIIDNRITEVKIDIEATEEKLNTLDLQIQKLQLEIEQKQELITKQKKLISALLRDLQLNAHKSSLEVLMSYKTFSDFYTNIHYLQTIETQLSQNVTTLRLAKEDLEAKEDQVGKERQSYEQLKGRLDGRKEDLEDQSFAKQNLLKQTKSSEQVYRTLLGNLKQQYQAIEAEIAQNEREVRKKLESQHKLEEINDGIAAGLFSWPTQGRYISAYFHDPDYPFRNVFEHSGIDIRAAQGTPIKAVASGYVGRAKRCSVSSCYSYVMIIHSGGMSTVYGHLSRVVAVQDAFVTRSDIIGYSGGTPRTAGAGPFVTGPHLHFEVRQNGIPVNPLGYMIKDY